MGNLLLVGQYFEDCKIYLLEQIFLKHYQEDREYILAQFQVFGRDPMNILAAVVLSALLARQEAVELKSLRFTELTRAVRALQGKVVIVDVWHRT